jgi:hypothetical protein
MGEVIIEITNSLDSSLDDESIGLGDIEIDVGQLST